MARKGEKKTEAENGGRLHPILFAHPSDSHHHIFTNVVFFYIKCSPNVQSSRLIMILHNTFHAWIPSENSSLLDVLFSISCMGEQQGTVSAWEYLLQSAFTVQKRLPGFLLFIMWLHAFSCQHLPVKPHTCNNILRVKM